jgi:uncharacterized coiled-coil protein SlyX
VDWEGRKGEIPVPKCEAGFTITPQFSALPGGGVKIHNYDTICVPTKHLIDMLIDKLSEAAKVVKSQNQRISRLEELVADYSVLSTLQAQNYNKHEETLATQREQIQLLIQRYKELTGTGQQQKGLEPTPPWKTVDKKESKP